MKKLRWLLTGIVLIVAACNTATPSPTSTPTLTSTPPPATTITPSPFPLVNLEGVLFFDYNGSGLRESEEPALPNFEVCIKAKDICVKTNENGKYEFKNIAPEETSFSLSIVDPNADAPTLALRYINYWKGKVNIPAYEKNGIQVPEQNLNDTVVIPIDRGITVITGAKNEIGLMQGFLTLPFTCNTSYSVGSSYDLDSTEGGARNWEGNTKVIFAPVANGGTLDQHDGIDYLAERGTTIISNAPGIVTFVGKSSPLPGYSPALVVEITHINGYVTHFGHIDKQLVELGQSVSRGQRVAEVGSTGTSMVHLHWSLRIISNRFPHNPIVHPEKSMNFDPYQDLSNNTFTFWTKDNLPQCLP